MNFKKISNSFETTKEIAISPKIQIENKEIYIIFEIKVLSINPKITEDLINEKIANKNNKNTISSIKLKNTLIANASVEPRGYLVKEKIANDYEYYLSGLNLSDKPYILKNKKEILKKFIEKE